MHLEHMEMFMCVAHARCWSIVRKMLLKIQRKMSCVHGWDGSCVVVSEARAERIELGDCIAEFVAGLLGDLLSF